MIPLSQLERRAREVRESAYAPYSNFRVGAALETKEGKIYTGCNIENVSYGLTVCAERSAVFAAVASGIRTFRRIVIVADSLEPITPCGACRQVLAEFSENIEVVTFNLRGERYRAKLSELLPRPKAGILDKPCST
jgi:cytidine deaminase